MENEKGTNYTAVKGIFLIKNNKTGAEITVLTPSKRTYFSSAMPITESARHITPSHDLYIALGEPINKDTWAIRLQYKPFIIWIWIGALMMALGGGIAATARRYQPQRTTYV